MTRAELCQLLGLNARADDFDLLGVVPGEYAEPALRSAMERVLAQVFKRLESDAHSRRQSDAAQQDAPTTNDSDSAGPQSDSDADVVTQSQAARRVLEEVVLRLCDPEHRRTLIRRRMRLESDQRYRSRPSSRLPLTAFDRQILAVLVAFGGWNSRARAMVTALAATHGVTAEGLIKVVRGLSEFARSRSGRVSVADITGGAARLNPSTVSPSTAASESASSASVSADASTLLDRLTPDLRSPGPMMTVKLSLLFGLLTILIGLLIARLVLPVDSLQRSVFEDAPPIVTAPPDLDRLTHARGDDAEPQAPAESRPFGRGPIHFDSVPTFCAVGVPASDSRDPDDAPHASVSSETIAQWHSDLRLVADRTVIARNAPSDAVIRLWHTVLEELTIVWPLLASNDLESIHHAIDEVIAAGAMLSDERHETLAALTAALIPLKPEEATDAADVWRGSWKAGMVTRLASHPHLPQRAARRAAAILEELNLPRAGRTDDDHRTATVRERNDQDAFHAGVMNWLDLAAREHVTRMTDAGGEAADDPMWRREHDRQIYHWWEVWLSAVNRVAGGEERDGLLLAVIERIIAGAEPIMFDVDDRAADGHDRTDPRLALLGRFSAEVNMARSRAAHDMLRRAYRDESRVSSESLWVFTSLLASRSTQVRRQRDGERTQHMDWAWFDDRFVPSERAGIAERHSRWDEADRTWSEYLASAEEAQAVARIAVDPMLLEQWRGYLEQIEQQNWPRSDRRDRRLSNLNEDVERIRHVLAAGYLVEAAVALTQDEERHVRLTLERLSELLASAAPARGAHARGTQDAQGPPDGVWAEQYRSAGRDVDQRLELLRQLEADVRSSGTVGFRDGEVLVIEQYRGGPPAVRQRVRAIIAQRLSHCPITTLLLLDHLGDHGPDEHLSQWIQNFTGRPLPPVRSANWKSEARVALIGHALASRRGPHLEIEDMAERLSETWLRQMAHLGVSRDASARISAIAPDDAARMLTELFWRTGSTPAESTGRNSHGSHGVFDLRRREQVRLGLAAHSIERALAHRLTVLDIVAADIRRYPGLTGRVDDLLSHSQTRRRAMQHVLEQLAEVESVLARLYDLKMVPQGGSLERRTSRRPSPALRGDGTASGRSDRHATGGLSNAAMESLPPSVVQRLERLDPRDPTEYFELAEDIADGARSADVLDLARHLFALAGALDPELLGRSAALALADLAEEDTERRRFRALADLLDHHSAGGINGLTVEQGRGRHSHFGPRSRSVSASLAVALQFSESLAMFRRGLGDRAIAIWSRDAISPLLADLGVAISRGHRWLEEEARRFRAGTQRPGLNDQEIAYMLLFEHNLLADRGMLWSSDLVANGGLPFVEVSPDRLDEQLGADPQRPYFRRGRWVRDPGTPSDGSPGGPPRD